jgi:hypothetical protein
MAQVVRLPSAIDPIPGGVCHRLLTSRQPRQAQNGPVPGKETKGDGPPSVAGKCFLRSRTINNGCIGPPRSSADRGIGAFMTAFDVHCAAQPVAQQVEAQRGDDDRDPRQRGDDWVDEDRLAQRVQHQPPFGIGRGYAEAEKGESGRQDDADADEARRVYKDAAEHDRHDLMPDDCVQRRANSERQCRTSSYDGEDTDDPTDNDLIKITPSGFIHLRSLPHFIEYISSVALYCPIGQGAVVNRINELWLRTRSYPDLGFTQKHEVASILADYLVSERAHLDAQNPFFRERSREAEGLVRDYPDC